MTGRSNAHGHPWHSRSTSLGGTFHAVALASCGRMPTASPPAVVPDPSDRSDACGSVDGSAMENLGLSEGVPVPARIACLAIYSFAITPELDQGDPPRQIFRGPSNEGGLRSCFWAYAGPSSGRNVPRYDDLLLAWAEMMIPPTSLLGTRRPVRSWSLSSEYHDTNRLRLRSLLKAQSDGRGVNVVGRTPSRFTRFPGPHRTDNPLLFPTSSTASRGHHP